MQTLKVDNKGSSVEEDNPGARSHRRWGENRRLPSRADRCSNKYIECYVNNKKYFRGHSDGAETVGNYGKCLELNLG